jgi:hypothetical protein
MDEEKVLPSLLLYPSKVLNNNTAYGIKIKWCCSHIAIRCIHATSTIKLRICKRTVAGAVPLKLYEYTLLCYPKV